MRRGWGDHLSPSLSPRLEELSILERALETNLSDPHAHACSRHSKAVTRDQ